PASAGFTSDRPVVYDRGAKRATYPAELTIPHHRGSLPEDMGFAPWPRAGALSPRVPSTSDTDRPTTAPRTAAIRLYCIPSPVSAPDTANAVNPVHTVGEKVI